MNSRITRDRGKRPGSPSTCRATILGLGGIGRQIALQLAALGVTRLQLVDPGTVGRRTHAVEGYACDDIGQPKVFAAARLCHQLNPQLDAAIAAGLALAEFVKYVAGQRPARSIRLDLQSFRLAAKKPA